MSCPPSSVMILLAFLSCFLSSSLGTKQTSFQLIKANYSVFEVFCVCIYFIA